MNATNQMGWAKIAWTFGIKILKHMMDKKELSSKEHS
jgi:hypothetical protein